MSNILVLNSSLGGEASVSRHLVDHAVTELTRRDPSAKVVSRDLASDPIAHLLPTTIAGVRTNPTSAAELEVRDLSDILIGELRAADTIVIGAPMYNFGIPTTLRVWFDYVLRAGETFSYSEAGPKGLLENKRVIVVQSRGGYYSDGPAQAGDFQEPYLRYLLKFIGLSDVTFIRAEKIGFGPDAREEAVTSSRAELSRLVA